MEAPIARLESLDELESSQVRQRMVASIKHTIRFYFIFVTELRHTPLARGTALPQTEFRHFRRVIVQLLSVGLVVQEFW
jgi:hypothetical protein